MTAPVAPDLRELLRVKGLIRDGKVVIVERGIAGLVIYELSVPIMSEADLADAEVVTLARLRVEVPGFPQEPDARDRFLHMMKGIVRPADNAFIAYHERAGRWLYVDREPPRPQAQA